MIYLLEILNKAKKSLDAGASSQIEVIARRNGQIVLTHYHAKTRAVPEYIAASIDFQTPEKYDKFREGMVKIGYKVIRVAPSRLEEAAQNG